MFNKKGELTSSQITMLVLTIAGFVIILSVILFKLDLKNYNEQDLCKLSVLTRATGPEATQNYVPLKCVTNKICLTQGSGNCVESFAGDAYTTIKLPSNEDDAAKEIARVTAEQMYQCWSMMGLGKLDLFGSYKGDRGLKPVKPMCVICGRVAVDKSVDQSVINNANLDVYEYMKNNEAPGTGLTYLQAYTDVGVNSYPQISSDKVNAVWNKTVTQVSIDNAENPDFKLPNINYIPKNREVALVFSQVKSKSALTALSSLGKDALVVSGASFVTPAVGGVARSLILNPTGATIAGVAAAGVGAYSVYNTWQGQTTAAGYCGQISSTSVKEGQLPGCSLVQAVPYDIRNINELCPQIDGNP